MKRWNGKAAQLVQHQSLLQCFQIPQVDCIKQYSPKLDVSADSFGDMLDDPTLLCSIGQRRTVEAVSLPEESS